MLEWILEIFLNPDPLLIVNPDLDPDSNNPDTPSIPGNDDLENNIEIDDLVKNVHLELIDSDILGESGSI